MTIIVQKFGGTSVGDPSRIREVADHVARCRRRGDRVVLVVSAMGRETDELLHLADQVSATKPGRELDMLVTGGERKELLAGLADGTVDVLIGTLSVSSRRMLPVGQSRTHSPQSTQASETRSQRPNQRAPRFSPSCVSLAKKQRRGDIRSSRSWPARTSRASE